MYANASGLNKKREEADVHSSSVLTSEVSPKTDIYFTWNLLYADFLEKIYEKGNSLKVHVWPCHEIYSMFIDFPSVLRLSFQNVLYKMRKKLRNRKYLRTLDKRTVLFELQEDNHSQLLQSCKRATDNEEFYFKELGRVKTRWAFVDIEQEAPC